MTTRNSIPQPRTFRTQGTGISQRRSARSPSADEENGPVHAVREPSQVAATTAADASLDDGAVLDSADSETSMDYVYHYTIGSHLAEIHSCGELRPSNAGALEEKRLIWFSSHPFWEPTVQKPMLLTRGIFLLSFEQTRDMLGCVRFALPRSDKRLMDRHAAYKYAGTPLSIRKDLAALGKRDGANPDHWMAVAAPIALQELRLEFLHGDAWTEVSISASASKCRPEPSIQFLPNLRKI